MAYSCTGAPRVAEGLVAPGHPGDLALPHRLGHLAKRCNDRRHREAGTPLGVTLHLLAHDHLGAVRMLLALVAVLRHHSFQVVNVKQHSAVHGRRGSLDIARHGDINKHNWACGAVGKCGGDVVGRDHRVRGVGRAHHHIGLGQFVGQAVEAEAHSAEALGNLTCRANRAVDDHQLAQPAAALRRVATDPR